MLFGLGAYLAKISSENMVVNGVKMVFVGLITAIAIVGFETVTH